jgi:uncharacterized membrane protein YraQ (UPF0718 family)
MSERNKFFLLLLGFLAAYHLPVNNPRLQQALGEALFMLRDYARQHILLCLVPAFFIAGAIATFISQESVLRYLGPKAPRPLAYGVAATSGSVLAVCSCTVLPLFAGIYKRGAGLGPAIAFLYSVPAINVLAIILTARVLGWKLGLARAVGAVLFSVVIGLLMALIFRKEEEGDGRAGFVSLAATADPPKRTGFQDAAALAVMVGLLVFANWGTPTKEVGIFAAIYGVRWYLVAALASILIYQVVFWFSREERSSWVVATWDFAKQITPLLFFGVLAAGFALGRPGLDAGVIPARWVHQAVGGNSLAANFLVALLGAFMYFATLTEVPIVQALLGAGMGPGPALALLLAGPALSLPNMLVINSYLGPRKTLVYCSLVVVMATLTGWVFGLVVA